MTYIFTDGACSNNGKKKSVASFAVYIDSMIIRGYVMSNEYTIDDNYKLSNTDIQVRPSNNRGELLAIVHALIYIVNDFMKNNTKNNYTLYSDSLISIRTINEWYYSREKKGTTHEFKNFDLIKIIMSLIKKIKFDMNIELNCLHVRSHQKRKNTFSETEKMIWEGNFIVDKYAEQLTNKNNVDYDNINSNVEVINNISYANIH